MLPRIIVLCVPLALLLMRQRCKAAEAPTVGIEMGQSGFHRELIYTVQFGYSFAGNECEYILEQALPAAVYISVDQLDDLKRLKKLNAVYPEFVDIEITAEKATAFTVLLKGLPKIRDSIKLPIHFRYYAPSDKSAFAIVDIDVPKMYINCHETDDNLIENELRIMPTVRYCLQQQTSSFLEYAADTSNALVAAANCNWKLVDADYQLKTPLHAKIPVGNAKSFPPILYATIICSWAISLWTIMRTHNVPRRINQKLEEQRILQNKIK